MIPKKNRKTMTIFTVLMLCITLPNISCGKKDNADTLSGSPEIYTIADPSGDWGFPTPFGHYSRGPGYIRMSFLFDTLIWKNQKGFVPALARKWHYDRKKKAYYFTLTEGVLWHDGRPFTAKDAAFTFRYIRQHPYPWVNPDIIRKVEAIDDLHLVVFLKKPYAAFLSNIAGTMPIIPEHIYENVAEPSKPDPELAVGTGPFIFSSYDGISGHYRFLANKKYYDGTPLVKEIRFIKMSPDMTGQALARGTINTTAVPADMIKLIKNKNIIKGNPDWVSKVMINHKKPPLDNTDIRKALLHAIDREAIVKTCLRGHGEVASDGLVPVGNPWYNPGVPFVRYAPSETHRLLTRQGYTKKENYYHKGGHILSVEILVKGEQRHTMGFSNERVAEMLKKQLESAGIKTTTVTLEAKTVDNRVMHWQFELALSGHGGLGGDPQMIARSVSGPGFNSSRYISNRKLLDLFKRQGEEMNTKKRRLIINDIQAALAEEIPSINLFYPTSYWAHDGSAPLFFTKGGIALGVPIPCNKLSFIKNNTR